MDGLVRTVCLVYLVALRLAIGEGDRRLTMSDGDTGDGVDTDKRTGVVLLVIVRTLHQCTLRIDIPQTHIHTNWRI